MLKTIDFSSMKLEDLTDLNFFVNLTTKKLNKFNKIYETTLLEFANEPLVKKFPWKYKINKYGYRDDNWNFKAVPAFFGCSFTFGIGAEHAFPYLFQKKIQKEKNNDSIVIPNLGMPGSSFLSIIKSFCAFSNLHPMTTAFITLPLVERFTMYTNSEGMWNCDEVIPTFHRKQYSTSANQKIVKNISRVWSNGWGESFLIDYLHLAESIAKSKKIKIFWSSWDYDTKIILKKYSNSVIDWQYSKSGKPSRDLKHPNQGTHDIMADVFFEYYKKYS
jgi:hypothetical protein